MKSQYSIISAAIRPEIGERITIGLLLVGDERVYYRFSKDKLNVMKELLHTNTYKYLKESLKQFDLAVTEENAKPASLFTYKKIQNPIFSEGYIEYLNRYSNNLLNFSTMKTIDLPADDELFITLFRKYVDDSVSIFEQGNISKFDQVKAEFLPRVERFYNLEKELSSVDFPSLPIPVKVDLIGKNESIVYAQMIELERMPYHIQNDVGILAILNQVFDNKTTKFVISSEPDKLKFAKQHLTWQNLRKNSLATYVDLSEIQIIKDYATQHGVLPLAD